MECGERLYSVVEKEIGSHTRRGIEREALAMKLPGSAPQLSNKLRTNSTGRNHSSSISFNALDVSNDADRPHTVGGSRPGNPKDKQTASSSYN